MDIKIIQKMLDNDGIIFLSYGGFLTQVLISSMTEALEKETENNNISLSVSNNMFTIFIELSQNMMNYSKTIDENTLGSQGLILVSRDKYDNYHIHSQNIVSTEDKENLEPKLTEIQGLDRDGIKKRYRELRRSGKNTHAKGGGIGFFEIAKRCETIDYEFRQINDNRYYFYVDTTILTKKDK